MSPCPRSFAALGAAALALTLSLSGVAQAAPETWQIDAAHSNSVFKVRHWFTPVSGRFADLAGTIQYDSANPTASSVELTIQTASIDTDNDTRDNHLRTDDFFNAEKWPTITFKSTKMEKTDKPTMFKVTGNLTIRDVTKPVTLDVEVLGFGPDAWGNERGGFLAKTTINRLDYGVKWNKLLDNGGAMLGDDVEIEFSVEAMRKKA